MVKRLSQVLEVTGPHTLLGFRECPVAGVACHPEAVTGPGFLFVCMDEYLEYNRWQTWRSHLEVLPALGLAAVVAMEPVEGLPIPQLVVADPRKALGRIARLMEGNPDAGLRMIGVTGTNGKTTTTRLLAHLLSGLGEPCGSLGTLGVELSGQFQEPGTYTTPLSPQLYRHLARFQAAGARAVAMEVSSHALALDRTEGLSYAAALLTNVERDHLDFHGTVEAYAEAKRRLFSHVGPGGWSVLNRHCPYWESFAAKAGGTVVTYGREGSGADVEARDVHLAPDGSRFSIRYHGRSTPFTSRLAGSFQVENTLAAVTLAVVLGYDLADIAAVLASFPPVCGRMEQIPLANGCTAIVDYAHNPDGLRHLLRASRHFCRGRLHVVFGCGGDRDKGKRPIMGQLASELADVCWVTSDNPRTEDPASIIRDVLAGMPAGGAQIHEEADRRRAIEEAAAACRPGDVLVVAGKGHEDYQLIGLVKTPFSDQAVLRSL